MQWTVVNRELSITSRQRSGYEYRVRESSDGSAILIAEGRISDGKPPTKRQECVSASAAFALADQWEDAL